MLFKKSLHTVSYPSYNWWSGLLLMVKKLDKDECTLNRSWVYFSALPSKNLQWQALNKNIDNAIFANFMLKSMWPK